MTTPLPKYQGTSIAALPEISTTNGRAWRLSMLPIGQRPSPDQDGTVAGWIVHCPKSHPFWDHYILSVIHLRPIPNVPEPKRVREGTTHEISFVALNPEHPLPTSLLVDSTFQIRFLTPVDLIHQFDVADDVIAAEILDTCVSAMLFDGLMPDQDFRHTWHQLIDAIAQRYKDGVQKVVRQ